MSIERRSKMKEKNNFRIIEKFLLSFACIAMLVLLFQQINVGLYATPGSVNELNTGWYYLKDGERVQVQLPAVIETTEGSSLTLYHDSIPASATPQTLSTRSALYHLKVTVGDQELYAYDDSTFPRNQQMASKVNCIVDLPGGLTDETVAFTYTDIHNGIYKIPSVYIGSSTAILLHNCMRDLFPLLNVFIMVILSILTIWISIYLKRLRMEEKRFLDIAVFLLLCGCWFLTDSSTAQTLGGSSPIIRYISFYAFMLLAIPMLHFVKNTKNMKNYRVIDFFLAAFYINAILQSILNYLGVFDFVQMLFVTHFLLAFGVGALGMILFKEYKKTGEKQILTILQSFGIVGGSGVISLIFYWLLGLSYYEIFFEVGIIIFILLLIKILILTVVENFHFKAEMQVYQRLSKEDSLTGLKNRRAFDELVTEIAVKASSYRNVFLVFMDINALKYTNDNYGHNAGDEMLISAARCIEKAFGEQGICFRIGGDEFCAVIINSPDSEDKLSQNLDAAIEQYNVSGRYPLSIARGISNLRKPDGTLQRISDWKHTADLNMYADKGWIKK